ncbi:MAG: hypothetical protein U0670_11655 [Anaerolineae bacterium]
MTLHTLQNEHWQAGILPGTGASVAYGRVSVGTGWRDVLRPTAEAQYGNSSNCSSFIMMPWCNRIKGGVLRFEGAEYTMRTEKDDGTARHGDVRKRPWEVLAADDHHIRLRFTSSQHADVNYPFRFTGEAEYKLDGRDFVWVLSLRNDDSRPMPAGFGHHPYFVREPLAVSIPCEAYFPLTDFLATGAPQPLTPTLDFRTPKPLGTYPYNHLLTTRDGDTAAHLVYEGFRVSMTSDSLYKHYLIYAPEGEPFYALEPMTNANDGFNLAAQGIAESGVFVLQPGETASAAMCLTVER